jgi:transcription initiation factor TFIIIB Brf1 subunit/transcription initiation factor TFIIB
MKYYCENCGTEFIYPDSRGEMYVCVDCDALCKGKQLLTKVPTYETIAQWKKRRNAKYNDTASVYHYNIVLREWECSLYEDVAYEDDNSLIAATEVGAPPDDWRPV